MFNSGNIIIYVVDDAINMIKHSFTDTTVLTAAQPQTVSNPAIATIFQQGQLANIQAVPGKLTHNCCKPDHT